MIPIHSTESQVNWLPGKRFLAVVVGLAIAPLSLPSSVLAQTPLTRATITNVRNRVKLKPKASKLRRAQQRDTLTPGDQLATGRASFAEFRFNEGTLARMGERAIFRFIPRSRKFILKEGTVLLLIPPGQGITQVRTPNVRTGIRGSALFIRHDENSNQTIVGALTDSGIEVSDLDGQGSQVLKAGQMALAVDGEVQGLYDFDLAKFFETSPLSEGILDGTVGTAEVLEEIQDGLEAQGNFAAASNSSPVMETPSFVKLSTADEATGTSSESLAADDRLGLNPLDELASQESSVFPGQSLGISIEADSSETAAPPVSQPPKPATPDIETPEPGQADPEVPEPEVPEPEVPKAEIPELEISEPELPEPEIPEPEIPEPEIPQLEIPEPEVPEPKIPQLEIPEPEVPEPEIPQLEIPEPEVPEPEIPQREIPEPEIPEPEIPQLEIPEPEVPEPEIPQREIPEPEVPVQESNDFPGKGNGVENGFPGGGNDDNDG